MNNRFHGNFGPVPFSGKSGHPHLIIRGWKVDRDFPLYCGNTVDALRDFCRSNDLSSIISHLRPLSLPPQRGGSRL